MSEYNAVAYDGLAALDQRLNSLSFNFEKELEEAVANCPSNLSPYDLVFAIALGIAGALLDTDEKLEEFWDLVHKTANSGDITPPKGEDASLVDRLVYFLAKLLQHSGDWIDKVPVKDENGKDLYKFLNRAAKKVNKDGNIYWEGDMSSPHRIFWGHDIFSIKQDNPFRLSIQQYGVFRGIIQAFRHLVADTCSVQGLPIPFSSWFDYTKYDSKKGKDVMCNKLLDFCQEYSEEVLGRKQGGFNNEVFNHMFSIHMQDKMATELVLIGTKGYCKAAHVDDSIRETEMMVIAYGFSFYGAAIVGAVTHDGVPYINWPSFMSLARTLIKLIRVSQKEISELIEKSQVIIEQTDQLEKIELQLRQFATEEFDDFLKGKIEGSSRDRVIDYFREG